MERNNLPGDEEPSERAELVLSIERAELVVSVGPASRQWGTFKGIVPADQAHHLVTTFGILGSLVTGTAGAVFTLHAAPGFATLAYAELALALIATVLIAVCDRTGAPGRRQKPGTLAHPPP